MSKSNWFVTPMIRPNARLRIICFPYAGGNASTYTSWVKHLPKEVELIAVQPPGRASRMFEQAYTNMEFLVNELLEVVPTVLDKPYIFFGHSLGSRVAFELTTKLKQKGYRLPIHYIASGSRGPHLSIKKNITYNLPDKEFKDVLENINGTPKEILHDKEIMQILLPLLRADFQVAETYRCTSEVTIDCLLTVLGGGDDKNITMDDLRSWENFFSHKANVKMLPGDHFFIDNQQEYVLDKVNDIVQEILLDLNDRPMHIYSIG